LFFLAAWNANADYSDEIEKGVCPSLYLSNTCIVTKQKKDLSGFLCHTKDRSA